MTEFGTHLPTLLDNVRILNLIKYSQRASVIPGYFCEFGIYKGGSLEILAKYNPNITGFGIDSFVGLPSATEHDFHNEGEFSDVDHLGIVGYFKMIYPNFRILKGFSPDVFNFFDNHTRFSFVHCDTDMYSSVIHACDFFYPRLSDGGIILFDDYGFKSTRGAKIAIDEFSETIEPSFKGEIFDVDGVPNKQFIIIK